jgi:hypothetical protein
VECLAVVAIGDVDASVTSDGMRIDGCGRRDAVFPFLLHLGVHDEQGVMWQVNRELAFGIKVVVRVRGFVIGVFVFGDDSSHAELAGYTEREGAYHGAWS